MVGGLHCVVQIEVESIYSRGNPNPKPRSCHQPIAAVLPLSVDDIVMVNAKLIISWHSSAVEILALLSAEVPLPFLQLLRIPEVASMTASDFQSQKLLQELEKDWGSDVAVGCLMIPSKRWTGYTDHGDQAHRSRIANHYRNRKEILIGITHVAWIFACKLKSCKLSLKLQYVS